MFAAMRQGSRYIDVCLRFNPASLNIDERNLVLYGLSYGYVRQLRKVLFLFSNIKYTILQINCIILNIKIIIRI